MDCGTDTTKLTSLDSHYVSDLWQFQKILLRGSVSSIRTIPYNVLSDHIRHQMCLQLFQTDAFLLCSVSANSYQCNQIPGVLAAEVSTAAEDDQRHKEDCIGHIVCPWITSHKILGIINKGEDGNKGESDEQLHCENHEDLVGQKKTILVTFVFRCHFIVMWITLHAIFVPLSDTFNLSDIFKDPLFWWRLGGWSCLRNQSQWTPHCRSKMEVHQHGKKGWQQVLVNNNRLTIMVLKYFTH